MYGWREPLGPAALLGRLRGELGLAHRELAREGRPRAQRAAALVGVGRHRILRSSGAILGSRADRLPSCARRRLSLERRGEFSPLDLDEPAASAAPADARS